MSRVIDPRVLSCFRPDPPPSWSDLSQWHTNSAFGCVPLSFASITAWIALEGGKNGCDARHLQHIIHRHTSSTGATGVSGDYTVDPPLSGDADSEEKRAHASEPVLDMTTMEYWWTHLRHCHALAFTHTHTDSDSVTDSETLTLTDDGVLFPPYHRTLIHREVLTQPFTTIIATYPTLRVTASLSLRHAVLGWQTKSSQPYLTDTLAVNYPSDKNTRDNKDSDAQSDESPALMKTAYCVFETLGKAAYCGLYQNHIHGLFGSSHSLSSLYPTIKWLKHQHLIVTTNEYSKVKLYHRTWKHRGDSCLSFRMMRTHYYRHWVSGLDARQRRRMGYTRETTDIDTDLLLVDDTEDANYEDESEWKVQPSPALVYELTWQSQIFRLIQNSGTRGCSSMDIREALGDLGVKSFDKLITNVNDIHKIKAVADRVGKQFIYRYYTQDNFTLMNQQENIKPDTHTHTVTNTTSESKSVEASAATIDIVPAFFAAREYDKQRGRKSASTPAKSQAQPVIIDVEADDGNAALSEEVKTSEPSQSSSLQPVSATKRRYARRGGQQAMTLITRRRRQYVMDELDNQTSRMIGSQAMNRLLTEKFYPEPAMYNQTAKAFYQSMATDGLIQIYPFVFPSKEGRSLQPVTVIRKRDRNEVLDSEHVNHYQSQAKEIAVKELTARHINDAATRRSKRGVGAESEEESDSASDSESASSSDTSDSASDASSSDTDTRHRSVQSRVYSYEVSRMLFGFLRPSTARARYLHAQLWTDYQSGVNPLVTRTSDSGALVFHYQSFFDAMLYKDFLVLSGIDEDDLSSVPDAMNERYYELPVSQLPSHIQALVEKHRKRKLLFNRIFNILHELKLIEDYDSVRTAQSLSQSMSPSMILPVPRSITNINSNPMISEYSLTPSYTVGTQRLDLSLASDRHQLWHHLRTISRRTNVDQRKQACQSLGLREEFVKSHLASTRHWTVRTQFRAHEQRQLELFDSATDEPLTFTQIQRVAELIQRPVAMVVVYYARRRYPVLAALHDSVEAYTHSNDESKKFGDMAGRKRKLVDDSQNNKTPRSKRKKKSETEPEDTCMIDVDSEEKKAGNEEESEFSMEAESDGDGETESKKRHRWKESDNVQLVSAFKEWMTMNDLDYQTAKAELQPPEGLSLHPVLRQLLPMMAVCENVENPSSVSDSNKGEDDSGSGSSEDSKASASVSVADSESEQRLIQARKDFVLHGTAMPHSHSPNSQSLAPSELVLPLDTPFNALTKARIDFIASKLPQFTLNQVKAHLRFVRRKLQVPRLRSTLLKITAMPHIEAMLASEPELVALMNITTVIVLATDTEYEPELAHLATNAYSDQQVSTVLGAMSKDHLITRRRQTQYGQRRAYRATRMYEEGMRAFATIDSKAITECQSMVVSMLGADYDTVFDSNESSSVGEAWAVIEAFDHGAIDFAPLTERPFTTSDMKDDGGDDDDDDDEAKQADNEEFKYLRTQLRQSSWLSLMPVSITDINELSQRPILSMKAVNANAKEVGIGHYHSELQSRFSVETPFGTRVIQLIDPFTSDDSNDSEDLSMIDSDTSTITDSDVITTINTAVQHEQALIQSHFTASSTVTLSQLIVSEVKAAGSGGLTLQQLIDNVRKQSTDSDTDVSTSLTSHSLTPIPIITSQSSTFDLALHRALIDNRVLSVPCHNHTRYIAQDFSSHWQIPDFRTVSAIFDEERQWHHHCTNKDLTTIHTSVSLITPHYGPSAITATPWRKLDSGINSEVINKLIDAIVTIISAATDGVSERDVCAQLPVWSPVHVRHGLSVLIGDDRIQCRVTGDGDDNARFYPTATLTSFHWTRMEL